MKKSFYVLAVVWLLLSVYSPAQVVPAYRFPDATLGFVRGLNIDLAAGMFYDDNIYYAVDGERVSAWAFTLMPQLQYSREWDKLFIRTRYRGAADFYRQTDTENPAYSDSRSKNMFSNFWTFELGYQINPHFLLRLKDDLDNTNRPDFREVDEMVYGRFLQNNFLASLVYRATDHLELEAGYGNHFTDYYRSDDSPSHDYINQQANAFQAALLYHFNAKTTASAHYSFSDADFPDHPELKYREQIVTGQIERQLNDQWHILGEAGVQYRDTDVDPHPWATGDSFYARIAVFMERERSSLGINLSRERSLCPNYSEDFYTDYWIRGIWRWRATIRNTIYVEGGYRLNLFETFPEDFVDPGMGTRDDNYYFVNLSYERQIRERILFLANYRYTNRDSNNNYYDFGKNVLTLGLRCILYQ